MGTQANGCGRLMRLSSRNHLLVEGNIGFTRTIADSSLADSVSAIVKSLSQHNFLSHHGCRRSAPLSRVVGTGERRGKVLNSPEWRRILPGQIRQYHFSLRHQGGPRPERALKREDGPCGPLGSRRPRRSRSTTRAPSATKLVPARNSASARPSHARSSPCCTGRHYPARRAACRT